MKKQLLAVAMLSTITLTTIAQSSNAFVTADEYDTQIQQKEAEINNLKTQESAAQAEVDKVQAQVDATIAKSEKLKEESAKLEKTSKALSKEVNSLNDRIVKRRDTIDKQARSVQTSGTSTNYLDVILDAESISDAIARVQAVSKIVSANNELLAQQKEDKRVVEEKQKENTKQIKIIFENQQQLVKQEADLKTQQAQLQAAQLGLQASRATAEGDRDKLLSQQQEAKAQAAKLAAQAKAEAEEKARLQAEAERMAKENTENPPIPNTNQGGGDNVDPDPVPTPTPTPSYPTTPSKPAAGTITISEMNYGGPYQMNTRTISAAGLLFIYPKAGVGTNNNTYVAGQCTWYVKSYFGSSVGDYWQNGGDWASSAAAAGCVVSSTPAPGTVAVFPPGVAGAGGYGHVAVVTAVG
ncbi:N-terminal domain of peptidoglycan hydrolase CwlO-containing protein [Pilibacter termitis]|uniref:N-terminal domain of peptidoglycan hydrolase CwlO-containing protein n=1 Tax=Pilibacter termitis TaxID=263852 RepID=A0A1T4LKK7_9ENTE|nr:CHAP domain-containing protein [Pilibacter termitis]SJZ55166.1 N-terminal domain of peptidoglycan hydrolase CwlO-containing protein [Pilibacter termitis]